jgi:hypothetical protein
MSELTVGSFVVHRNLPDLGVGKVFCVGQTYACVGFIDAAGRRDVKRLDKSFVTPFAHTAPLPQFDGWKVETTSGCYPVSAPSDARKAAWTLHDAYARFQVAYPDGFAGEAYQRTERAWRVTQADLYKQLLPEGRLRELASTDPLAAGALLLQVIQTREVPLLASKGELPMMSWALTKGAPGPFLSALADVVDSPVPTAELFTALASALESIPTQKPTATLLTWPTLTVVPFLARPDAYLFVKPQATQAVARKLGRDLLYLPRPSWDAYQRMLALSRDLLDYLKPRGAQDLIDVQAFIATIGKTPA